MSKLLRTPGTRQTKNCLTAALSPLTAIAGDHRISARAETLAREYALEGSAGREDILRAAGSIGLKSRIVDARADQRLKTLPTPAIASLADGTFAIFGGAAGQGAPAAFIAGQS